MKFGIPLKQKANNLSGIWFAWHPVRLKGGRLIWMERVRREVSPFHDIGLVYDYYELE